MARNYRAACCNGTLEGTTLTIDDPDGDNSSAAVWASSRGPPSIQTLHELSVCRRRWVIPGVKCEYNDFCASQTPDRMLTIKVFSCPLHLAPGHSMQLVFDNTSYDSENITASNCTILQCLIFDDRLLSPISEGGNFERRHIMVRSPSLLDFTFLVSFTWGYLSLPSKNTRDNLSDRTPLSRSLLRLFVELRHPWAECTTSDTSTPPTPLTYAILCFIRDYEKARTLQVLKVSSKVKFSCNSS